MRPLPSKINSARNKHLYLVELEEWAREAKREINDYEKLVNRGHNFNLMIGHGKVACSKCKKTTEEIECYPIS